MDSKSLCGDKKQRQMKADNLQLTAIPMPLPQVINVDIMGPK
ncbi:MAG: hypothetical protein ACOYOD_14360 [Saprospiraceae bacterium]|jgi:hypothetical protein